MIHSLWDVLGTSFCPTLLTSLTKHLIVPLDALKAFLLSLCLLYRAWHIGSAISTFASLRWQSLRLLASYVEVYVLFTSVPVTFVIDIQVAHIIATYLANLLPIPVNFTIDVVVFFHQIAIVFVVCSYSICFISERNFACEPLVYFTDGEVSEFVMVMIENNLSSIGKLYLFVTLTPISCLNHIHVNSTLKPACVSEVVIWTLGEEMYPWRRFACLF